ncbi:MAG TPA: SMP-30/gluconolactonase/LRE family protein, partial [Methylomirabilota bacterium]|nr:SMP-30/gluconolactonase/LRE family protein [Methylomirabilota bacterium]
MKANPSAVEAGQSDSVIPPSVNRRGFLRSAAFAAAGVAMASRSGAAERDWTGANPIRYPDPSILVLDARFARYKLGNTPIQRLHSGMLWAEGPAWNGVGKYLLWSDIP